MNKYYPFELHCHTTHSDGSMSVAELIDAAKERGLVGIGITDHNTYSGATQALAQSGEFVILKGIEWTTFWGHFTAFGAEDIDWRSLDCYNINHILEKAKKMGAMVSVAHPFRLGNPVCSGCRMEYPIDNHHNITGYEIMSGPSPYKHIFNSNAILQYDKLLSQGYKIAALYGYDWHSQDKDMAYAVTYLAAKCEKDALRAIKEQNTFVSLGLNLCLKLNDEQVDFGSTVKSGEYNIEVQVYQDILSLCKKFSIIPKTITIKNNQTHYTTNIENNSIRISLQKGYFRVEVRGNIEDYKDALLISTSPIYIKGV